MIYILKIFLRKFMKIGLVDSHNLSYEYLAKISRPNKKNTVKDTDMILLNFFLKNSKTIERPTGVGF